MDCAVFVLQYSHIFTLHFLSSIQFDRPGTVAAPVVDKTYMLLSIIQFSLLQLQ